MSANRDMERKSSAVTLSDMEVFIFPELIYSLVLANIMSPRIWRWRDDPWFEGVDGMKPYRRITRVKQYIMDHYTFNLDLDTWGLTTKERELARFRDFIDPETLRQSNALFGYEGDRYYFDIDIRTHFGLDKYEGNVIPYWKTETVEAMDAFRHRPGYATGAGECVSLSALYAAALFLIARIPLKDICMMATPLHSQNFVDVDDGILTNNRRLVTRKMWFNGTAISAQARRALENERVTLVAHETGCIHTLYAEATISAPVYHRLVQRLRGFLKTPFTAEILGNYLRHHHDIQKCFQLRWPVRGADSYIGLEKVLEFEHGSSFSLTDDTRAKLLDEIEAEEFQPHPLMGRIVFNDLESFVREHRISLDQAEHVNLLRQKFACDCLNAERAILALVRFCHTEPRVPDPKDKKFVGGQAPLDLDAAMSREEMVRRIESVRAANDMAAMAFYAYRDLTRTEAEPFLAAAVQRSPVSILGAKDLDEGAMLERLQAMPDESIYDGAGRLAQPDEVWNYGRGDGAEKALLLANLLRARHPEAKLAIEVTPESATLRAAALDAADAPTAGLRTYRFSSRKLLRAQTWDCSA